MRLAIIRQRYNPYGGAERFVTRAAISLAKEGVAVTVFAREWKSSEDEGSPGTLVRCNPFYMGRTWRDWSFARHVCAEISTRQFDLVQSHEKIACCDIYRAGDGVHAQWLKNRARSLGIVGRLALAFNAYHAYLLWAERRLFSSSRLQAIVCNSNMVRDEIRTQFGVPEHKLKVIYNGVDLDAFNPGLRAHRIAMRQTLGIANDAMVYLFVGSGFERKGLRQTIDALAGIENGELIVIGEDKTLGRMRKMCRSAGLAGRVHFVGGVKDVKPWYGAADCFVLPTLYDPFPNAVLEAMASGLPVITSRQCGAAEILDDGRNGIVCDAYDVAGIRAAMAAIGTPEAGRLMGDAARAAVSGFGLPRMASELTGLYRTLMADRSLHA